MGKSRKRYMKMEEMVGSVMEKMRKIKEKLDNFGEQKREKTPVRQDGVSAVAIQTNANETMNRENNSPNTLESNSEEVTEVSLSVENKEVITQGSDDKSENAQVVSTEKDESSRILNEIVSDWKLGSVFQMKSDKNIGFNYR